MRPIFDLLGLFGLLVLVAAGAYWFHFREDYELNLTPRAGALSKETTSDKQTEQGSPLDNLIPLQEGEMEIHDVIVTQGNILWIAGLVTNRTDDPVSSVLLLGTVTDREGNLLGAEIARAKQSLDPGGTTSFQINFNHLMSELPPDVETKVTVLGWEKGEVEAATVEEPNQPPLRRGGKDPRLEGKVLGY